MPPLLHRNTFIGLSLAVSIVATPAPSLAAGLVGYYPNSEAVGDFNNDGKLDRVMGLPHDDQRRGKVLVWLGNGSQSRLVYESNAVAFTDAHPKFSGNATPNQYFGSSVVVGDFDGNGYDDIAFGSPGTDIGQNVDAGAVYVMYGQEIMTGALASVFHQDTPGILGAAESYDRFGEFLAVGDFNGDGFDDLAVGAPREDLTIAAQTVADVGVVHVIYGSPMGLTSTGNQSFSQVTLGATYAASDQFGAALVAGRFATGGGISSGAHDSLVVGAPGRDINGMANAGAIYHLSGSPSGVDLNSAIFLHQDISGVDGTAAANENFGARLGKIPTIEGVGFDLWIGVPGEGCGDPDTTRYQIMGAGANGLSWTNDVRLCSHHVPSLIADEVGRVVEKSNQYGSYLQYVPTVANANSRMLVLVHGTPGGTTWADAQAAARLHIVRSGWIAAAERENLIIVAPIFDTASFGSAGGAGGGYRGLYGRFIQADAWVNRIVDSYQSVGLILDGRLFLYGHSAGGQFASRYIMRNPYRFLAAAISSPNTVAWPDYGKSWSYGLGAINNKELIWQLENGTTVSTFYSYMPSERLWRQAVLKPVFINVGEQEQEPWSPGDTHVQTATNWKAEIDGFEPGNDLSLCIIPNKPHASSGTYQVAVEQLFPNGYVYSCVQP